MNYLILVNKDNGLSKDYIPNNLVKVKEKTGVDLEILSGDEEGELSFLGAYEDFGVTSGVMADVGGGSSEVIAFKDGKIVCVQSVPIGSLKAFKNFVAGEIPTKGEAENIKKEIVKLIYSFLSSSGIRLYKLNADSMQVYIIVSFRLDIESK